MATGPLSDERVRIIVPAEPAEAAGIEALGVLPQAGVVTGPVEVEDDVVAMVEAVPAPGEWLPDPSRNRGAERIEATHFLDEGLQIGFVPLGEGLPPLRVAGRCSGVDTIDRAPGQDRPRKVDDSPAAPSGLNRHTAAIGAPGEDGQAGPWPRINRPFGDTPDRPAAHRSVPRRRNWANQFA